MILPILIYGNPILKKEAKDILKDYEGLNLLIDNMFETMKKADGVGLAAPQVGLSIRLFVINLEPMADEDESYKDYKKAFINARILEEEGEEWLYKEGCLSVPTIREEVRRKPRIHISYFDENWEQHDEWLDGIKARVIQHEYDHLQGILFPDRLSALKKRLLKGKIAAISKGKFEAKYKIQVNK